jgi:hypothetical protein
MAERIPQAAKRRGVRILAGMALLLGPASFAFAAGEASSPARLPLASAIFEQNATDGDVEVVFKVKGRDEGLAKLSVVAPDGRTVIDFAAPGTSAMGIREFVFESPEPTDVAGLKAAYPSGTYRFAGATAGGEQLRGESTLSHELPATTAFVQPGVDAEKVPVKGLEIRWTPVAGVSGYVVELEQDDLGVSLEAHLPGSASSLWVPDGFLRPGTEYDLGIGSVSEGGNVSFVETSFTTAEK